MQKRLIRKFFLLTRHTDREITEFIQKRADEGLLLKKVDGNRFYFEECSCNGTRLCALTLYAHGHAVSTEMQVREELPYLRNRGWDVICIGRQETVSDSRRHVFLTEEKKGSEIPLADDRSEKRAELRGKFKALSNLLMCIMYVGAAVFLFSESLIKVVTSNIYIAATALFVLSFAVCSVLCVLALAERFVKFKNRGFLDISTRLVSITLIAFAAFMLLDTWISDKPGSERIKVGSSTYKLYKDEIPVGLEDLNADITGGYRTTRRTESESFLASYLSCFDESFGIRPGDSVYANSSKGKVEFISYTIFRSPYSFLLDSVSWQLINQASEKSDRLTELTACDAAYTSSDGTLLLAKGNAVMKVKSGFALDDSCLKKLAGLL